jgi:hypothetical protein
LPTHQGERIGNLAMLSKEEELQNLDIRRVWKIATLPLSPPWQPSLLQIMND